MTMTKGGVCTFESVSLVPMHQTRSVRHRKEFESKMSR
uniref:Uncharacterized protein n=1 Tax=Anguilla anguilla TaxID=7936 RepID=A0A0E9V7W7_ANGAN